MDTPNFSPLAPDASYLPFAATTADVMALDNEFCAMVCKAIKHVKAPAVIETSASFFGVLVPDSLRSCPMLVLWLPDSFACEVEQFANFAPRSWEVTSVDLLKRRVTLEWESDKHCLCVPVAYMDDSLNKAYRDGGRVLVAFVAPTRMAVTTFEVDEGFMTDLQVRGLRSDENYLAVCEYTEEELATALTASVLLGNARQDHDFGKTPVYPIGKRYR